MNAYQKKKIKLKNSLISKMSLCIHFILWLILKAHQKKLKIMQLIIHKYIQCSSFFILSFHLFILFYYRTTICTIVLSSQFKITMFQNCGTLSMVLVELVGFMMFPIFIIIMVYRWPREIILVVDTRTINLASSPSPTSTRIYELFYYLFRLFQYLHVLNRYYRVI